MRNDSGEWERLTFFPLRSQLPPDEVVKWHIVPTYPLTCPMLGLKRSFLCLTLTLCQQRSPIQRDTNHCFLMQILQKLIVPIPLVQI